MKFKKLLGILILVICSCANTRPAIEVGKTFDVVGPDVEGGTIYWIDLEIIERKYIENVWFYEKELDLHIIHNEKYGNKNETALGLGARVGVGRNLSDNVNFSIHSGLSILDGKNMESLAVSSIYGTLRGGIEYKDWGLFIDHMSSPFHGGEHGDYGITTISIRKRF